MNKKFWIYAFIIIAFILGVFLFVYFNNSNTQISKNENTYQTNKTSTDVKVNESENKANSNQTTNEIVKGITETTEEQLSTFSTKIYDTDPARIHNLTLTCSRLNGTVVKKGDTFSFTGTLGPSNESKGYQKADVLDNNGKKYKEYGGGNCQISTTIYNAVLAVPTLVVTERHAHSNYVPYIQRGKDAAVAYGSYDLKFRNDSGNDVKILTSTDGASVTATLMRIK